RLFLAQTPGGEIALEVDVEERRGTAERHRRAVLFLDAGEIAEVQPLHGLLRGARRRRNIEAVGGGHLEQLLQRANLLRELLAIANDVLGRRQAIQRALFLLLVRDQAIDAV